MDRNPAGCSAALLSSAGAGETETRRKIMGYTVKEFAEMFHITEHTIRYYTDIQLLPCRRDEGGRRVFDEESVNWMRAILYLKNCGMSVKDIQEYCRLCRLEESGENLRARYRLIARAREQAHRKARDAQAAAEFVDRKARHYEEILAGLKPDDTNPERWTAGGEQAGDESVR